jgi:hypothetical protein
MALQTSADLRRDMPIKTIVKWLLLALVAAVLLAPPVIARIREDNHVC